MKYVSIDIETTGLSHKKHQLIEFGAVLEDTENFMFIEELPKLRVLVVHDNYTSNSYCIKMHSKLFEELGKYTDVYLPQRIDSHTFVTRTGENGLGRTFRRWLKDNKIDITDKIVVAGKNFNGFDAKFLKFYMQKWIKFNHRVLDPVTLFTLPCDKEPPNLNKCAKRAGIDFKGTGYHTAVSDAVMVVELLRAGWNRSANKESYE